MRNLASIQVISSINPISGADKIEVATVLGWNVVVKKNEFKVGDLIVYCEIDSILPEKPEYEFLRNKNFKIKTIKLKGQISQGIIFPLSILPKNTYYISQDVTELMGVTKYEPPLPNLPNNDTKGNFPSFLIKSDETRIQSLDLKDLINDNYMVTEKLDGTSFTSYYKDGIFGVCSRNYDLIPDSSENIYCHIAKKYNLKEKLSSLGKNIAIQGEIIGPRIQKNKYKLKEPGLYLFNIYNIDTCCYLSNQEFLVYSKLLGLNTVPIEYENFSINNNLEELIKMADGLSKINKQINREGLVFKAYSQNNRHNPKKSFKIISNKFLLKNKE